MAIDILTGTEYTPLTESEKEKALTLYWDRLGYSEEYICYGWLEQARKGKYDSEIRYKLHKPDRVEFLSNQINQDERNWINSMLLGGGDA